MATAKKSAAQKLAVKKTAAKKTAVKKTAVTKTAAKKTAVTKTPGKATAAKSTAAPKESAKKVSAKKPTSRKYGPQASEGVREEMHEMKRGELTIGKSGKKVTNPKQAIAIGLAKARREGAKVPPNPNTGR